MKIHQFIKKNCDCPHRETVYTCIHCGTMEYASYEEVRSMDQLKAACTGDNAPEADPVETLRLGRAGRFNCLAKNIR